MQKGCGKSKGSWGMGKREEYASAEPQGELVKRAEHELSSGSTVWAQGSEVGSKGGWWSERNVKGRWDGAIVDNIIVLYGKSYSDGGDDGNGAAAAAAGDDNVDGEGGGDDHDNGDNGGGAAASDDDGGDGVDDADGGINNSYCLLSLAVCLILCKIVYMPDNGIQSLDQHTRLGIISFLFYKGAH